MDTDKIIQDLNRRFAAPLPEFYQRRIIFWYDEDKEFEDKLDEVVMEKQETQRSNVLADVEEIYEYPKDTSTGVSKDISEKCLLGKWLIEEPYALIGHVRFCEGLL